MKIDFLSLIANEIHSVVIATTDEEGLPVTCAIDIMDSDENSLYFLTAKGKGFFKRLKNNENIAFTGLKGKDTMSSKAVSVRGKAEEIGESLIPELFAKNPYMNEIYPTSESRKALTVFKIYCGTGELFDLSQKPIQRYSFTFGNTDIKQEVYYIKETCIGCRICASVCPQQCIKFENYPAEIKQENCLHCGNCLNICPQQAIIKVRKQVGI